MASEWEEVTLDAVYEFRSGLSKPRAEFGFGHDFLSFKDVFYNSFMPQELSELVNSTDRERESCSIRRGDVFLTRTSETMEDLGVSCVALRDYKNATFNGFTKRLRPKDSSRIVPEYAAYFFRSPRFRRDVTALSSLSTRASLNNDMLSILTIVLPSIEEQTAIGIILKGLDDKIELNRRMNGTLESMARAIFKAWFIDFEPVKAKAAGAASFPGIPQHLFDQLPNKLTNSELGLIPKGWKVGCLGDVVEILDKNRIPLSRKERAKRQGNYPYYGATGVIGHVDGYLFEGVHVLLGEDGSVVDDDNHPFVQYVWGRYWVNNHAHVLKGTNSVSNEQLCLYLKQVNILPFVTGAVQLKLNQKNMKAVPLVIAPQSLCQTFAEQVQPLFALLRSNTDENATLAVIRDVLLPKLILGEIRVSEAESAVEEVL